MKLDPEKLAEIVAKGIQVALTPVMARLAALEAKPGVSYAGVYTEGRSYTEGNLATLNGGLWLCLRHGSVRPGTDPAFWTLIVKSGQAG